MVLRKWFESSAIFDGVFLLALDYLQIFKSILHLLFLELRPEFHISNLKITSLILQVDDTFDFGTVISEMGSHFFFLQKIYKDVSRVQITPQGLQACPSVVSARMAVHPEFLHELLLFLKRAFKHMIKEDQMNQITSHIYQISTIMNSVLRILEQPYAGDRCVFSPESTCLVVDILCMLMPKSSDMLRDFNIMDKVMGRLQADLQIAIAQQPLYVYRLHWEQVTRASHHQLISQMLKLLS